MLILLLGTYVVDCKAAFTFMVEKMRKLMLEARKLSLPTDPRG